PQGLAIPLTQANKRRLEVLRQRRAEREAHEFNTMSELAKGITKLTCLVKVKTGDDGKMFGSVTSGTIADELKHQFDILLDKKKIHLDHPIRTLGEHEIELRLHPEVRVTLKVTIESTTPLPVPAEAPEPKPGEKGAGPRTEKRARRPEPRSEGKVDPKPADKSNVEGGPKPPGAKAKRPERPEKQK
ncbi:MAG TPA: 50S ribosomal protein L9, partial [Candidatus Binatia bacterium]|nr:50S ribosomal protein L9 [Candidatus Binatia bacterium]